MQLDQYLGALAADGEALAGAAEVDLDAPVATCPGWSVARLVTHTGRIHRWAAEMVRTHSPERIDRGAMPQPPQGPTLIPWFREGLENLTTTLREAGPDVPVWTFRGAHTASFWYRRMAQETSVHRWDGERAVGRPTPIAPDLAADGMDELLDVFVPDARPDAPDAPAGRIRLTASDHDGEWELAFGDSSVTAAGAASDLLLFAYGRTNAQHLQTAGHLDLLRRWQTEKPLT